MRPTSTQTAGVGFGVGYYAGGSNTPHNDTAVGDVTGGTIQGSPGTEEEEDGTPSPTKYQSTDTPTKKEDPDKQGAIRFVKGARLVYKRETGEGTYTELWIYNTGKKHTRDEYAIRQDILAGTDIELNKTASVDNTQSYTMWTSGDAQMIKITGLPS